MEQFGRRILMRPLARFAPAVILLFALGAPAWSGENGAPQPGAANPPAEKKATAKAPAADSPAVSADAATPADPATPAAQPSAAPAPPPSASSDSNAVAPVAPTLGERATTFTLESGEMLGRHVVALSAGVNKFSRAPGDVTVLNTDLNLAYGINDRISVFIGFDPNRHLHVGRPGQLSLNLTQAMCGSPPAPPVPLVRGSVLLPIDCGVGPSGAAYVEDFPFANHNGGGVGPLTFGLKANLLSQYRDSPIAFSVRTDFSIPTVTGFSDLQDNQAQSGRFNWQIMAVASRRWGKTMETTLTLPFVLTLNPHSGGVDLLNQAKQFRPGFGFTVFPDKRFQIISEYSAVIFVGSRTQNTTFGPRDPVEGVWGVRLYPWRILAIDLGFRETLNLNQVSDRYGFVIRVATTFTPAKKVVIPPSLSCDMAAADPSSVDASSGTPVNVTVRANASDSRAVDYSYDVSGGRIEGTGPQVRWNYSGLSEGDYTITPAVTGGNLHAVCSSVSVHVVAPPPPPPRLACSVNPSSVYPGEYAAVTAVATDPKGNELPYPVTYRWATSGGSVKGSGPTVQLDTTDLAPGTYTVTARAEGKGGAADCNAPVVVNAKPQAVEIARCNFKKFSASVSNACKNPPLDGVSARFKQFPDATLVIEALADPSENKMSASPATKTPAKAKISPEDLAKERAKNVKADLVKRLGLPDSAIQTGASVGPKGGGQANQTMTITLVPQGAKYEPKAPR
jgi:hypothetical protein